LLLVYAVPTAKICNYSDCCFGQYYATNNLASCTILANTQLSITSLSNISNNNNTQCSFGTVDYLIVDKVLQLKSTPTLPPPKTIKNDSERIATHLQLTEWLYYAILPREAWIFLPNLRCSTLGTAESFTIARLSKPLQSLPYGYYQIHCRALRLCSLNAP
jgi:hypothetical protein